MKGVEDIRVEAMTFHGGTFQVARAPFSVGPHLVEDAPPPVPRSQRRFSSDPSRRHHPRATLSFFLLSGLGRPWFLGSERRNSPGEGWRSHGFETEPDVVLRRRQLASAMPRKKATHATPPPSNALVQAAGELAARQARRMEAERDAKRKRKEGMPKLPPLPDVSDHQDVELELEVEDGPGPRMKVAKNFLELYEAVLICIKGLESGVGAAVAKSLNGLAKFASQADDGELVMLCRRPGILEALAYVMQNWRFSKFTETKGSFQERASRTWMDEEDIHDGWQLVEDELVWCEEVFSKRGAEHNYESSFQNYGICASSILYNLSLHKLTGGIIAKNRYVLSVAIFCVEDMAKEDAELVENAAEILLSAAKYLDLSTWKPKPGMRKEDIAPFASQERLLKAVEMLIQSQVETQHMLGCRILAKLASTPANEEWVISFGAKMAGRLIELLREGSRDSRAAAVDAIHSFTQSDSTSCRRFGSCPGCFSALIDALSVASTTFDELGWKSALVLEHLATDSRNREVAKSFEGDIANLAMSKTWAADVAASTLLGLRLNEVSRT